jgi:hypothetical protein
MNRLVTQIATMFAVIGVMTAGSAFAQQAVASAAAEPAHTATATHSDPIVQKRMEVREANQKQRARTAEARKNFRAEARDARSERNQSAQESRARATQALQTSQTVHPAQP